MNKKDMESVQASIEEELAQKVYEWVYEEAKRILNRTDFEKENTVDLLEESGYRLGKMKNTSTMSYLIEKDGKITSRLKVNMVKLVNQKIREYKKNSKSL